MSALCGTLQNIGLFAPIGLLVVAVLMPFLFMIAGKYADRISADTGDHRRRVVDFQAMITRGSLGRGGEWFRLTVLGVFVLMGATLAYAVVFFGFIEPTYCGAPQG